VAAAEFSGGVALAAGLVGLSLLVKVGVGTMRRERGDAMDARRDSQDQAE